MILFFSIVFFLQIKVISFYNGISVLTKNKTIPLRGILAMCIVLHHISRVVDGPIIEQFYHLGAIVVSLFFFMSGYGLWKSWVKKRSEYVKGFLYNRIIRTLIYPFVLFTIIYKLPFLFNFLWADSSSTNVDFTEIFERLPNSWFVIVILFMYFIFYFICKYIESDKLKIFSIVFYSFAYIILSIYRNIPECWYVSVLAFPLGVVYAYYERNLILFFSKENRAFYISIVPICLCLIALGYFSDCKLGKILSFPLLAYIIVFYSTSLRLESLNRYKFLIFLSEISYEIYLCHGIIIEFLRSDYIYISSDYIFILLVLSLTLLLAYWGKLILGLLYRI